MDQFEKFVQDHREDFDSGGPSPRVWEGLQAALEEKPRAVRIRLRRKTWMKAAGWLLLAGLAACLGIYRLARQTTVHPLPEELREVQSYYSGRINTQLEVIERYPEAKTGLSSRDLQAFRSGDSTYLQLRQALRENPGDTRIRAAFVEYYQSRLEALDKITGQLQQLHS
ncbi:hypothetical protein [Compostibacter hankyongensis]|uniref:DUF3379 domain-containing protein n=1 Tax=Compostibacter hankyongensis TaxID=1007089 RepID=A0ABP8FQN5_9BACT